MNKIFIWLKNIFTYFCVAFLILFVIGIVISICMTFVVAIENYKYKEGKVEQLQRMQYVKDSLTIETLKRGLTVPNENLNNK